MFQLFCFISKFSVLLFIIIIFSTATLYFLPRLCLSLSVYSSSVLRATRLFSLFTLYQYFVLFILSPGLLRFHSNHPGLQSADGLRDLVPGPASPARTRHKARLAGSTSDHWPFEQSIIISFQHLSANFSSICYISKKYFKLHISFKKCINPPSHSMSSPSASTSLEPFPMPRYVASNSV